MREEKIRANTKCFMCKGEKKSSGTIQVLINQQRRFICSSCYVPEDYNECVVCKTPMHKKGQSLYKHKDYCHHCYPVFKRSHEDFMYLASFKPTPIFRPANPMNGNRFYGVELEVEYKPNKRFEGKVEEYGKKIRNLLGRYFDEHGPLTWPKYDGSLKLGVELVTHPCTIPYHNYKFPWADICEFLESEGWSGSDKTSGMHIHASQVFDTMHRIQIDTFITIYQQYMKAMARRGGSKYAGYRRVIETSAGDHVIDTQNAWGDRSRAVNFTNSHTVEFRLFQSTTKANIVLSSIELCDALVKFTRKLDIHTMLEERQSTWEKFLKYIERYRNLSEYAKGVLDVPDNL